MKFEELFNKTIFEELFENQKNDFESYVTKNTIKRILWGRKNFGGN